MEDTRTKSTVLIDDVKPDPNQPRKQFTEKHISELATSILTEGFISPIECDFEMKIIVGECRYRAAKQAGLTEIPVIINSTPLTPYQRLRRQISENMMQSGGDKSELMNPIDTAKGLARLLILKAYNVVRLANKQTTESQSDLLSFKDEDRLYQAISAYSNKELLDIYQAITKDVKDGLVQKIIEETGIKKTTIWELLHLLDQPEFVIVDIQSGRPRTLYREADRASKEIREKIKEKIAKGEYKNRDEITQDVEVSKRTPSLALFELERQKSKESLETNRVLNSVVRLGLALEAQPLKDIDVREKIIVINQLRWIQKKILTYLNEEKEIKGEILDE